MNEPLHPSTLGEILDRTVQLYRGNFLLFAGTAALPVAVLVAVGAFAGIFIFMVPGISAAGLSANIGMALTAVLGLLVAIPIYIAAYVFSIGGLTQAAVSAQRGELLTIRAALASVRPRFWTYFGYLFLQALIVLIPAMIAGAMIGILIFLGARGGAGIGTGLLIGFFTVVVCVAAVVAIIWLALCCSIGMAVCVAERKPAWDSLQRAMHLSKGTRGRIFVMFLLVMVLSWAVSMVSYLVFTAVIAVVTTMGTGSQYSTAAAMVAAIMQFICSFSVQMLLAPVSWIALVLFYFDQRIRKEGFDIEMMMEQAGLTQTPPAATLGSGGAISAPAAPPDTVEER